MAEAPENLDALIGRHFNDEGEEYVVMRFGPKQWKRSVLDAGFYAKPGKEADVDDWEWSTAAEVVAFVKKMPTIDDDYQPTLELRAEELDEHPLASEDVDESEFWSLVEDDDDEDKKNAKEGEKFFAEQRTNDYLSGVLAGMMYGAMYSLADLGRGLQKALLFGPVRVGTKDSKDAFCSYINTSADVIVNAPSFEILTALMWIAGFREIQCARGVTKWVPSEKGERATEIIDRLVGFATLKTGINSLVKVQCFTRLELKERVSAGCIIDPMRATDAEM